MCFSIPCKIEKIVNNKAAVSNCGNIFNVDISLLPKIKRNDWILVQGDLAFKKISKEEAEENLNLLEQFSNIRKSNKKGGRK